MPVLFLLETKELGVADGDRGRTGEQRQQLVVLGGEDARLALLDEREAADDAEVAEAQRHRERGEFAPLLHEVAVDGVEPGVGETRRETFAVEDDGAIAGPFVQREALADPGQVGLRELPRPGGGRHEPPVHGVVLVEVALPDAERLGDAPGDDGGRVLHGERLRDLRAGLDREAVALALGR